MRTATLPALFPMQLPAPSSPLPSTPRSRVTTAATPTTTAARYSDIRRRRQCRLATCKIPFATAVVLPVQPLSLWQQTRLRLLPLQPLFYQTTQVLIGNTELLSVPLPLLSKLVGLRSPLTRLPPPMPHTTILAVWSKSVGRLAGNCHMPRNYRFFCFELEDVLP